MFMYSLFSVNFAYGVFPINLVYDKWFCIIVFPIFSFDGFVSIPVIVLSSFR